MYGEFIIGLNMLFNYVMLSFANKVVNGKIFYGRLILASFVGAVPVTFFPNSAIAVVVSFFGMTIIAFGKAFEPWKNSAVMVLIGAVIAGGLLTAFQYRIPISNGNVSVLIYVAIAYIALYYMKKKWVDVRTARRISELTAESTLCIWGTKIELTVYVDSGNSCTEPLSGAPVHFVSFGALEPSIPTDLKESILLWDPLGPATLTNFPDSYLKGIRLVRLHTVQGQSWAVGMKFDEWIIEGGNALEQGYIVLTKEARRYPADAKAILHVSAMETIYEERGTVHAA